MDLEENEELKIDDLPDGEEDEDRDTVEGNADSKQVEEETSDEDEEEMCMFCSRKFTDNIMLTQHLKICEIKKNLK